MTGLYRAPAALDVPAPWRWTRPRVADFLGLWRWPWGRRLGGGRWAMHAVVPWPDGFRVDAEARAAMAAYYGDPGPAGYAESMWADAMDARWRPVDHCPHGAFIAPVWPDGRLAMLWCACDCEVHPNCGEASP